MSERARKLGFALLIGALIFVGAFRQLTTLIHILTYEQLTAQLGQVVPAGARAVGALGVGGLALVLALRAGARAEARALALLMVLWPGASPGSVYFAPGTSAWLRSAENAFYGAYAWFTPLMAMTAFGRFSVLFPLPLDPAAIERVKGRLLQAIRRNMLRPTQWWCAGLLAAVSLPVLKSLLRGNDVLNAGIATLVLGAIILTFVGGARNLADSYRRANAEQQRTAFWLLEGLIMFTVGLLVLPIVIGFFTGVARAIADRDVYLSDAVQQTGEALAMMATAVCIAFATFYRGAIDSKLIVRNTAIYGLLAAMLLVFFVAFENLLAGQIARLLNLDSGVGTWITGIIAVLSVTPLHGWLRRKILPPTPREASRASARP